MKIKNVLITAIAIFGLATITNSQVPSYVPTNGLVGWWPFNGNANDESGNGNNGTVNGATLTADRNGVANKAYSFDGVNDYINCINSGVTGNSSRSVSFWIKSISTIPGSIFSYGTVDNNPAQDFRCLLNSSCTGMACSITGSSKDIQYSASNTWDHFIIVFDNSTGNNISAVSIFKNSILQSTYCSNNGNGVLNTSGSLPIFFGRYHWLQYTGNNQYYNGLLDDIAHWNRVLTQQEITDLYNGCQLSINYQPTNQTININNNAQFVIGSSDTNSTFQWQTDLGVGFQNLNSVGQYSGTTNDTLIVSNVTLSNNNQPFRCIISSGSCSDTSNVAVLTVNNNVGINQFAPDNLFSVYPNPAQTVINVKADLKLVGEAYSVIDNTGRVVLQGKIVAEITNIELGNLSNGIYLFQVKDNFNQSFRIVKN
jgi:hypothetical protein